MTRQDCGRGNGRCDRARDWSNCGRDGKQCKRGLTNGGKSNKARQGKQS